VVGLGPYVGGLGAQLAQLAEFAPKDGIALGAQYPFFLQIYIYIYIYVHTHTHTYI